MSSTTFTTAAILTTRTAATTAAERTFTGLGLVDCQGTPHPIPTIHFFNCTRSILIILHLYKAEASCPTGHLVHDDACGGNVTKFPESLTKILRCRGVGEIPHVDVH